MRRSESTTTHSGIPRPIHSLAHSSPLDTHTHTHTHTHEGKKSTTRRGQKSTWTSNKPSLFRKFRMQATPAEREHEKRRSGRGKNRRIRGRKGRENTHWENAHPPGDPKMWYSSRRKSVNCGIRKRLKSGNNGLGISGWILFFRLCFLLAYIYNNKIYRNRNNCNNKNKKNNTVIPSKVRVQKHLKLYNFGRKYLIFGNMILL